MGFHGPPRDESAACPANLIDKDSHSTVIHTEFETIVIGNCFTNSLRGHTRVTSAGFNWD